MSSAVRAIWVERTSFEVADFCLPETSSTVISAPASIPKISRVTSISTSVNPSARVRRRQKAGACGFISAPRRSTPPRCRGRRWCRTEPTRRLAAWPTSEGAFVSLGNTAGSGCSPHFRRRSRSDAAPRRAGGPPTTALSGARSTPERGSSRRCAVDPALPRGWRPGTAARSRGSPAPGRRARSSARSASSRVLGGVGGRRGACGLLVHEHEARVPDTHRVERPVLALEDDVALILATAVARHPEGVLGAAAPPVADAARQPPRRLGRAVLPNVVIRRAVEVLDEADGLGLPGGDRTLAGERQLVRDVLDGSLGAVA